MALPPLIEKPQRDWLFKVTEQFSQYPERDICLIGFFLGTPCTTLEINRIHLKDVLSKSGKLNKFFIIRGSKDYHGDDRRIYLSSKRLIELVNKYLEYRVKNKISLGNHPDHYLGLNPDEGFFISRQGQSFSIVLKRTPKGKSSYSCDALNRHLKKLLKQAGIENPSILSGRRTFAVNLHRKGFDIGHIHHLLGNKTLETTKKILTTDPVDIGKIAAQAF